MARSVRKYVRRVTRGITGAFNSSPKRQNPDPAANETPAAQTSVQATAQTTGSVPTEVLPVTKVPALDTVDAYVVDRQVEDSVGASQRIKLSCSSDVCNAKVIDGVVAGYARFVSALTGLEDVAFYFTRHSPFVSSPVQSIITASPVHDGDQSKLVSREADAKHANDDEIQFYAELGFGVGPENGEHRLPSQGTVRHPLLDILHHD